MSNPSTKDRRPGTANDRTRYVFVLALVVVAFLASYNYAAARTRSQAGGGYIGGASQAANRAGTASDANAAAGAGGACACCGGGGSSEPIEGSTQVSGGVQKIAVDLSSGSYNPNVIVAQPGTPIEITFGQGSGCLAQVMSQQLGFFEDLSGGPKTVKLPALGPGEYAFSCGMQMVFGKIVVKATG